jgi:DNA-binding NarL/FixJ family response regulator
VKQVLAYASRFATSDSLWDAIRLEDGRLIRIQYRPTLETLRGGDVSLSTALTSRENEVLSLLARGASNKVIARELEISVHTAKFHVASVLAKLGARNRSDAVVLGIRRGLILL